jgi:hypothetical protein
VCVVLLGLVCACRAARLNVSVVVLLGLVCVCLCVSV